MSRFNSISSYIYISLGILLFMFSGMLNGGREEAGEETQTFGGLRYEIGDYP